MTFSYVAAWALNNYGSTLTVDGNSHTGVDLTHLDTLTLGTSGHSEVNNYVGWAESYLNPSVSGDKQTMLITMIEHWEHLYKIPVSEAGNYQVSAWLTTSYWAGTPETHTMALSTNGTGYTDVDTYNANAFLAWKKCTGQIEATGAGYIWVKLTTGGSMNPMCCGLMLEKEDAGTQYNQSAAGTTTPAGALVKSVGKPDAGSLSPSGALARLTTPGTKAGSITPAGTTARLTAPGVKTGTLAPSGALATALTYGQAVAGVLAPSGVLARSATKPIGGTLTPTGTTSSAIIFGKAVAGTIAAVGALARGTAVGIAGVVTPAGAMARQTIRDLAGIITPSGALSTLLAFYKLVVGSIAQSGGLSLSALKALTGIITPAGSLSRTAAKTLIGTIAPEGGVLRSVAKAVAGALAAAGVLAAEKSGAYLQAAGGVITAAGSLTRSTARTLAGTLVPIGGIVRAIARRIVGALTPGGSLGAVTGYVMGLMIIASGVPIVARIVSGTSRVAKVVASAISARASAGTPTSAEIED